VVGISGGTCTSAAVVLGGLVPSPLRAAAVEKALVGQPPSLDVIASAAAAVAQDLKGEVLGDLFASADYRRATAPVWVKRAISLAASGAR
jgi:CO/xanthine dehydrogenase FAD-binding subunit